MKEAINSQFKICYQISEELAFGGKYVSSEANPFLKYNEILKTELKDFSASCAFTIDDLNMITGIRLDADKMITKMHNKLYIANGLIEDVTTQQEITNFFINLEKQLSSLDTIDKAQFKIPLATANCIFKEIVACNNKNEALRYSLSTLVNPKRITNRYPLTYFFRDTKASSLIDLEFQLQQSKGQLASHTHKLLQATSKIHSLRIKNNMDPQANNSVEKFRTNSQVLAFAPDSKRRPARGLSALGFVKE